VVANCALSLIDSKLCPVRLTLPPQLFWRVVDEIIQFDNDAIFLVGQ